MSQTRTRITTQRGSRGGTGFQQKRNYTVNYDEQNNGEQVNKPFASGNRSRPFKRGRGNAYRKTWNDNQFDTYNEEKTGFEEECNTEYITDGTATRGANKQGKVKAKQEVRNDSLMRFNNDEQQRAFDYMEKNFNQNREALYNMAGNKSNQHNRSCYKSPQTSHSSNNIITSRSQTSKIEQTVTDFLTNSNPPLLPGNVSKPPLHAQNPIFVGELMNRFNSILPPSSLLSPEKPEEKPKQYSPKTSDETFVSDKVNELFRQMRQHHRPNQQFDNMLSNKQQNHSEKSIPVQFNLKDNAKSYNQPTKESQCKGGRESKSMLSGSVERNSKTVYNTDIERRNISNDQDKTSAHHVQFQNSLGTTLFAEMDKFESKYKFQEGKNTEQSKNDPASSSQNDIANIKNSSDGTQFSKVKSNNNLPAGKIFEQVQRKLFQQMSTELPTSSIQQTHSQVNKAVLTQDKQIEQRSPICKTPSRPQSSTASVNLMDNNLSSSSEFSNRSSKNEQTLQHLSAENSCKRKELNPNMPNYNPKCNKNRTARDVETRNSIFRQFGFQGKSTHDKDGIMKKQNVKPMETALPTRVSTNGSINSAEQRKRFIPQGDETVTSSQSAATRFTPYSQEISAQQSQSHGKENLVHTYLDIDNNDGKSFLTRSNKTSTLGFPELTNGKVAGRNVYNIHQPTGVLTQRTLTRDESVRRLEIDHTQKIREHKIKQEEKEAKKRAERLERYKYVDQGHRLTEGYLDEAVGGYDAVESEEEARQRQQDQLRRDALIFQEQERKRNEERLKREEEKKRQELEKYKHVSSGHKLSGTKNEDPHIPAAHIESEKDVRQRQQDQLRRDALIHQEKERKENEERLRKEEELKRKELEKYKHVSAGYRLGGSQVAGCTGGVDKPKTPTAVDANSQESQIGQQGKASDIQKAGELEKGQKEQLYSPAQDIDPAEISTLFMKFLQTSGVIKKCSDKKAEEITSQLQTLMANASKAPDKQDNNLQKPVQIETTVNTTAPQNESSVNTPAPQTSANINSNVLDSPKKLASHVLKPDGKDPILVIRPSQEALVQVIFHRLAVHDMDKNGNSSLYKPQEEQIPLHVHNKFELNKVNNAFNGRYEQHSPYETIDRFQQQKPQNEVVETICVQKSLDEVAKSTGAIPKQKNVTKNSPPAHESNPSTSNESEMMEIDLQAEMRAARLRMQQRYEESLRKQQDN